MYEQLDTFNYINIKNEYIQLNRCKCDVRFSSFTVVSCTRKPFGDFQVNLWREEGGFSGRLFFSNVNKIRVTTIKDRDPYEIRRTNDIDNQKSILYSMSRSLQIKTRTYNGVLLLVERFLRSTLYSRVVVPHFSFRLCGDPRGDLGPVYDLFLLLSSFQFEFQSHSLCPIWT